MSHEHHTREFRLMRSVALWLHNFKCYNCNGYPHSSHVHHLNHEKTQNALPNLVPLCRSCHDFYHRIPPQPFLSNRKIVVLLLRKIEFFSGNKTLEKS